MFEKKFTRKEIIVAYLGSAAFCLTPREDKLVRMKFHEDGSVRMTYPEIQATGEFLNLNKKDQRIPIGSPRLRQMMAKIYRKLGHVSRLEKIGLKENP